MSTTLPFRDLISSNTPTVAVLSRTPSYAEAERVVDSLSDRGFPVQRLRIVGTGVTTVEQVTGRMTKARAALMGAGSGAWAGLFVGLIVGLFVTGAAAWFGLLLGGLAIGAAWGAVFGFVAQAVTRGTRDFSSVKGLGVSAYEVQVDAEAVDEARRLLAS